jgi:hypothetical protein
MPAQALQATRTTAEFILPRPKCAKFYLLRARQAAAHLRSQPTGALASLADALFLQKNALATLANALFCKNAPLATLADALFCKNAPLATLADALFCKNAPLATLADAFFCKSLAFASDAKPPAARTEAAPTAKKAARRVQHATAGAKSGQKSPPIPWYLLGALWLFVGTLPTWALSPFADFRS